jgi:hypothetical protein
MKRFDQIIGAYYSPEVEDLKKNAWDSFRMAIGCGIAAVVIFAVLAGILFFSLIFQSNPLKYPLGLLVLVTGIPALVLLVPASWVFAIRYLLQCKKAKEAVDRVMRDAIRNEQAAGNTTPPPFPRP